MKVNKIKIVVMAVISMIAGISVYSSQKADTMSDIALANVEALARGESGGTVYCCGNYGSCMIVFDGSVSHYTVAGTKFFSPCIY